MEPVIEQDASLAEPRTQLAWRRTAAGFVILALVQLRGLSTCGVTGLGTSLAVLTLVAATAFLATTSTDRRRRSPLLLTCAALLSIASVFVQEVSPDASC